MDRSSARRVGLAAMMVVAATAVGGVASASSASLPVSTQAPRITVPAPAGSPASPSSQSWVARNWSGYAVDSAVYTSVTGTWIVPTVMAPAKPSSRQFSSTWVGIDGFNDEDLIQSGTEQDWVGGVPSYQAWWEVLPAPEMPFDLTVQPGDTIYVSITQGSPDWTITMTDETTGQTVSKHPAYKGPLSSAEWIQEAPEVGGRIAPLAHDTTVDFEDVTANGRNPELTVADSGVMAKGRDNQVVLSTPSIPDSAHDGFAVAYGPVPPLPPTI
jgi:Peptidase A4 family